jgi:predicted  nucleic acid-binding Zn-ribbon protein
MNEDDILEKENEIADIKSNYDYYGDKIAKIDKRIVELVNGLNEIKDWSDEMDMYKELGQLSRSAFNYTHDIRECDEQIDMLRQELKQLEKS